MGINEFKCGWAKTIFEIQAVDLAPRTHQVPEKLVIRVWVHGGSLTRCELRDRFQKDSRARIFKTAVSLIGPVFFPLDNLAQISGLCSLNHKISRCLCAPSKH